MEDKATSWIKKGIEVFAKYGNLELNTVCKEMGKSKSSFYHIYPNDKNSRGFDRYNKDLIEHHERIVNSNFEQIRKVFVLYKLENSLDQILDLVMKYSDYHVFTARVRYMAERGLGFEEYWKKLSQEYLEMFHYYYKAYNIHEDNVLDEIEMRLFLDSFMHYEEEYFHDELMRIFKLMNKVHERMQE